MIKSIAYCVTPAEKNTWVHTCSRNMVLSLVPEGTDKNIEQIILTAFNHANTLVDEVRNTLTQGKQFDGGLFLIDLGDMVTAMNTIDGMGLTSSNNQIKVYQGTPAEINLSFFKDLLGYNSADMKYINSYFMCYMRNLQLIAKEHDVSSIGLLIGTVEYQSLIKQALISFNYVTVTNETKEKFLQIDCRQEEILPSYQYHFNVGRFNYSEPT